MLVSRPLRRIKIILYWLPILWEDYDFDHAYLYIIMRHKIQALKEHFKVCNWHIHKNELRRMDIAITALNRLIKDEYNEEDIHSLYIEGEFVKREDGLYECTSRFEPEDKFKRLCEHQEKLRKQDLEMFAKIFIKHSRSWWC